MFTTRLNDYDAIQKTISALRNAPADLVAKASSRLAPLEADRAAWLAKEAEITHA